MFKVLGLEFLKSERAKYAGLELVLERLGIEVGYKNCNAAIDFFASMILLFIKIELLM